jgi:hypothetical protein
MKRLKLIIPLIAITLLLGCDSIDKAVYTQTPVIQADGTVRTELVPKQAVSGAVSFISSLPIPYAAIAGLAATTLMSMYSSIRNKRGLQAVVTGVDAARQFLHTTPQGAAIDSHIKDLLIKHQEAAGVFKLVSGIVDSVTDDTVPPIPVPGSPARPSAISPA